MIFHEAANNVTKKGPKIDETLAQSITYYMRSKPEASLQADLDNVLAPENCPGLEMVRVNEPIWRRLPQRSRAADTKIQRAQNVMLKGVSVLTLALDSLVKSWDPDTHVLAENDFKAFSSQCALGFQALGAANYEFCAHRKEVMRPHVDREYAHLCASSLNYTDQLFGDDVTAVIKDISASPQNS